MASAPGVTVHELHRDGTTILRLEGPVTDPGVMVRLAKDLVDSRVYGGHIVLDLDGLAIHDSGALCALLTRLAAVSVVPIPTVVSDPGTRGLLRACGSGNANLACFSTLDEAIDLARPSVVPA